MCNIWLRSDGRVERNGGGVLRHTDSWHEWVQDNFYGGSATKRIVIKEPSLTLQSGREKCQTIPVTPDDGEKPEKKMVILYTVLTKHNKVPWVDGRHVEMK